MADKNAGLIAEIGQYMRAPLSPGSELQASALLERCRAALEAAPMPRDTERLDWLDAHPTVILRSGKQHIRPFIDAAMQSSESKEGR